MKTQIVVCRVGQSPRMETLDAKGYLAAMQKIVGGLVECLHFPDGVDLWCNEDGRYSQPFNRNVMARVPEMPEWARDAFIIEMKDPDDPPFALPGETGYHQIFGDFFFAGVNGKGETISLTPEQIKQVELLVGPVLSTETPSEKR